uniref:Uncharacterized protein n=1 Tax=Florenciella parvula TaxID=236787 RepID=A0A7S2FT33_9STRA
MQSGFSALTDYDQKRGGILSRGGGSRVVSRQGVRGGGGGGGSRQGQGQWQGHGLGGPVSVTVNPSWKAWSRHNFEGEGGGGRGGGFGQTDVWQPDLSLGHQHDESWRSVHDLDIQDLHDTATHMVSNTVLNHDIPRAQDTVGKAATRHRAHDHTVVDINNRWKHHKGGSMMRKIRAPVDNGLSQHQMIMQYDHNRRMLEKSGNLENRRFSLFKPPKIKFKPPTDPGPGPGPPSPNQG